jgi:hypothetical protein
MVKVKESLKVKKYLTKKYLTVTFNLHYKKWLPNLLETKAFI